MIKEYYKDQKVYKIYDDSRKRSFANDNIIKVENDPKFEGYYLAHNDKNETILFSDEAKIIYRFPANSKIANMESFLSRLVLQPDIIKNLDKINDLSFFADKKIETAVLNTLCLSKILEEKKASSLDNTEALKEINEKYDSQARKLKTYFRQKKLIYNNRKKVKLNSRKSVEKTK